MSTCENNLATEWANLLIDEAMSAGESLPVIKCGQVFRACVMTGDDLQLEIQHQRNSIIWTMVSGIHQDHPQGINGCHINSFLIREGRLPTPDDDQYRLAVVGERLFCFEPLPEPFVREPSNVVKGWLISEVDLVKRGDSEPN